MKSINQMNAKEMADYFDKVYTVSGAQLEDCADRLRELHDLTRWIPVSERMPTEDDSYKGRVLWKDNDGFVTTLNYKLKHEHYYFPYWKRITPPEDK
jgi:hypothetical protein